MSRRYGSHRYGGFPPYVPVAQRRANARKKMDQLRKQGRTIEPVEIEGRTIARSFWGKGWCDHLESFSDYDNRLPRGRTYARNGSVCHLAISSGRVEAIVVGSELYDIKIAIKPLGANLWSRIKERCAGEIGSMLELLQGKLSHSVMAVVTDREAGLFPQPEEIHLHCTCPDWAVMCKHVAAVLYGVGNRLDDQPDLLFALRQVDPAELIGAELALPAADAGEATLADDQLADVFGIDLDVAPAPPAQESSAKPAAGNGKAKATKGKAKTSTNGKAKAEPRDGASSGTPGRAKVVARRRTSDSSGKQTTDATTPASRPKAKAKAVRDLPPPNAAASRDKPLTGKAIARLRGRLGLSVTEFAAQVGVAPSTVQRWEAAKGRASMQPRCAQAVASLQPRKTTRR